MTDRITLTDEEVERLRSCDSTDRIITDRHLAAVESIVAARVAEALRDAANRGDGKWLSHAAWQHHLRALANEYDPKEEA